MEDRVKITIEEQEVKLKESITALGIDLTNLTLSDANADYMRIKWKTKDVILQKNYTLKVKDAATVGKVYLEMDKLNIRDAFIEKVTHSKIEAYKKEVRIGAIKDAKDKADYLLNAIGESTGKPLVVVDQLNEIQPNHFSQYGYAKLDEISSYDKNYGGSMGTDVVQFSKIKIKMNIYVKFGIK